MTKRSQTTPRLVVATVLAIGIAGPAAAAEGGLVLVPHLPSVLALIAFFVLLIFPMNALVFRPIFAALDAREQRIAGTRARADELAAQAERSMDEYEQAVRSARDEAEQGRKAALSDARDGAQVQTQAARADAETELDRATGEIDAALATARGSLRSEAEALAREAATAVLGRNLS